MFCGVEEDLKKQGYGTKLLLNAAKQ